MLDLKEFLDEVVTTRTGWFVLAYGTGVREEWREEWFGWPDGVEAILNRVNKLKEKYNVYFSPYLFAEKSTVKENVLPSRTLVADLDEANVLTLSMRPSVLVQTSQDRHQGYWILKSFVDISEHENYSRRLTYSIPRCDRTGWFLGKLVRIPSSKNHKYAIPFDVKVVDVSQRMYDPLEFDLLPTLGSVEEPESDLSWVENAKKITVGPHELMRSVRSDLPSRVVAQYSSVARDRSAALWALMTAGFRAGLTREEVFHLASNSANNKFAELRYGGVRELAKDVLRAEASVITKTPDARARILEARRLPGSQIEKRAYIASLVREHLQRSGNFIACNDGSAWYVRDDIGRPVPVLSRNETLQSMIDNMFGLNASEVESPYCINSLISFTSELPPVGIQASLSYYDPDTRTLLLHTGRRDVLKVTAQGIETVVNGYNSVVFPWSSGNETVQPNYKALEKSWDHFIFDGCLENVIGIKPEQARALLRVWFLTVLLRNAIVARPILALFGQPGAGKSTLFRRIYVLMYGRGRSLNAVTDPNDFDYAVSSDPLVVLDNVDTWEKWLPDRLALSAATSEATKRKLYTNGEVVTIRRTAMLGITAHNPKFGREDVTDRLLLLNFQRLQHFQSETEILQRIGDLRNALWGSILQDVQKTFATPLPESGFPQFRVEDFARFGYWIACALGIQDEFSEAINYIRGSQKLFVLEEDGIIVAALEELLKRRTPEKQDAYYTAGQWWSQLEAVSADKKGFESRYSNAVSLGRKLWSLQDTLRELFDIHWRHDSARGAKVWRIRKKENAKEPET